MFEDGKPTFLRCTVSFIRLRSIVLAAGCLLLGGSMAFAWQQDDGGTRVVFLGDSITEAGAGKNGYVTLLAEALKQRHGDKKIEVIGAGISGNRVPDLQKRLEKDVLSRKPALVVIYIGINDVWHSQNGKGTSKEQYESGLKEIVGKIRQVGSQVILCTPTVIGEKTDGSNKLDTMLEEYSTISREVAKATGATPLDLRRLFVNELKTLNTSNNDKGVLTSDGVHLNDAGNVFLKDIKHVVLFKFKSDAKVADINRVCDAFAELPKKIEGIVDFQAGSDISPENLSKGFTHCYLVTFKDIAARDTYLTHEAHQAFVQIAIPVLEEPLVVDFWGK
jgi:lysophospholipase L1-like esterase